MACYPGFRQTKKRALASVVVASLVCCVPTGFAASQASTTIVMRLVDTILSDSDQPGRQYRAVVAQATTAGSVSIPVNTQARIMLVRSEGNWSVQLSSLSLNGRTVAVTSSSVSATSPLQNAQQGLRRLGGILGGVGGLGNRLVSPATAVAGAVATGPRIVLSTGTTLTFTASVPQPLVQASAPSNAEPSAAPAVTGTAPVVAGTANPASVAALQAEGGPVGSCDILVGSPSPGVQKRYYISAIFDVPNDNDRDKWEVAWGYYIQARDKFSAYSNGGGCAFYRTRAGAEHVLQNRKNNLAGAKLIETGWVYTGPVQPPPPPVHSSAPH